MVEAAERAKRRGGLKPTLRATSFSPPYELLIYVHTEQELDDVEHWYPASHYVMIDDKLRLLSAIKRIWGDEATTVFVKQGHRAGPPRA